MPFFLSLSVRVLVLLSLCFTVFGHERQLRAKRLEDVIEREQSLDKRGICYDDDTYESFKYWIVDSAPYCSSLLGLSDITRTVSRVSRTTTTTVSVSYATRTATTTVPAVTIFSTIFSPLLNKREAAAATTAAPNFYQENPYAYPVYAGDAPNASIAASYYSVCSCLSLKPSTVDDTSIILSTRTINGRDSQETTSYVYVTTGTTTSLLTRQGFPSAPTTRSSTIPVVPIPPLTTGPAVTSAIGTGSSIVGSLSSNASPPFPSSNTSLSLSNTFASSGTQPTIAPTFSNLTSFSVPSLTPTISSNATSSGVPFPSANASLTTRPSSGFSSLPGYLNTSLASSGFPTLSFNSTITSRPSSGFLSSVSGLPTSNGNLSVSSLPTVGFPTNSINASSTRVTSGSPISYMNSSSTISVGVIPTYPASFSTIFVTVATPQTSSSNSTLAYTQSAINATSLTPTLTTTPPSNLTGATGTTVALTATPNLERNRCPDLNSTVITLEDGQAFAVVCSTEYGGPTDIGLSEKSFNDCIQDCATTNNGFSAVRCRGVTYFADRASGVVNCNFKNLAGLAEVYNNPEGISAVLIEVPLLGTTIPVPTSFPTLLATPTAFVLPEIP